MERAVIQRYLDINNIEASKNAGLHRTLDTCFGRSDILLRDGAADNLIDELIALFGVGLDADLDVTVLTASA